MLKSCVLRDNKTYRDLLDSITGAKSGWINIVEDVTPYSHFQMLLEVCGMTLKIIFFQRNWARRERNEED